MITVHINMASQLHVPCVPLYMYLYCIIPNVLFQRIARASLQAIPKAHKGTSTELQMHVHVAEPFGVELHIVQLHVASFTMQQNTKQSVRTQLKSPGTVSQWVLGFQ